MKTLALTALLSIASATSALADASSFTLSCFSKQFHSVTIEAGDELSHQSMLGRSFQSTYDAKVVYGYPRLLLKFNSVLTAKSVNTRTWTGTEYSIEFGDGYSLVAAFPNWVTPSVAAPRSTFYVNGKAIPVQCTLESGETGEIVGEVEL